MPPLLLGLAMLGVVVAAAVAPNVGAIPAVSSSQYGGNPSPEQPSLLQQLSLGWPWLLLAIILLVLASVFLLSELRRGGGGGAGVATEETLAEPVPVAPPVWDEPAPPAEEGAPAAEPAPVEPEPQPPPVEEQQPQSEIDRLMKDIDKMARDLHGGGGEPPP